MIGYFWTDLVHKKIINTFIFSKLILGTCLELVPVQECEEMNTRKYITALCMQYRSLFLNSN